MPRCIQHGTGLELLACDANKARWELDGNGQIKLASSTMCLTLSGLGPGLIDVARSASVFASSTLDVAHGVLMRWLLHFGFPSWARQSPCH